MLEKSRERKYLRKEILRVLKKNSLRRSTRTKVKEINIGFFPRNIVEILSNVVLSSTVDEQMVNKLILQCTVLNFVSFNSDSFRKNKSRTWHCNIATWGSTQIHGNKICVCSSRRKFGSKRTGSSSVGCCQNTIQYGVVCWHSSCFFDKNWRRGPSSRLVYISIFTTSLIWIFIAIHCDDKDSKGDATEETSGCITIFAPLQLCSLWIGNEKSKDFAKKIKASIDSGKSQEFDEGKELTKMTMFPGNLYIFSGGFPHGGDIYKEDNVRVFFRVYTADRQGSNSDQYYFENRSLIL